MNSSRLPSFFLVLFFVTSLFSSVAFSQAQHNAYGSLWSAGPGVTTDLILEGMGEGTSAITPVTVTLYSPEGSQLAVSTVNVPSQGVNRLTLSSMLPQVGTTKQGGLSLAWTGAATAIRGKVQLNDDRGIGASYLLHGGFRSDTQNALFAPWYFPNNSSEGQICLFNSSPAVMRVQIGLVLNGAEQAGRTLTIQPKATGTADLRSILSQISAGGATIGSLVLRYTGPAHSLEPSLLLSDPASGFALMPEFLPLLADNSTGRTSWQFPNVPIASATKASSGLGPTSYVLISNGSNQTATVQLSAYSLRGAKTVQGDLPPADLGPYQTRLLPLNEISGILSPTIGRVGLTVSHSGSAGKLALSVFSVDRGGRTIAVPSGLVISASGSKVAFWNAKVQPHNIVQYAVTAPGGVAPYVTLYYQSSAGVSRYTFPHQQVPEEASRMRFTIPSQSGRKDLLGNNFPEGVSSGVLILAASAQTAQQISANQPNCAADCSEDDNLAADRVIPSVSLVAAASQAVFVSPDADPPSNGCCSATLRYRQVIFDWNGQAVLTKRYHTFWDLISNGVNWIVDAGPDTNHYLVAWRKRGLLGHYYDDNRSDPAAQGPTGTPYQVSGILDYQEAWPYVTGRAYIVYMPDAAPNSNTFTHWAANYYGIQVPASLPFNAPGW